MNTNLSQKFHVKNMRNNHMNSDIYMQMQQSTLIIKNFFSFRSKKLHQMS